MDIFILFFVGILSKTSQASCPNLFMFDGDEEVSLTDANCWQIIFKSCGQTQNDLPKNLLAYMHGFPVSQPRDFKAQSLARMKDEFGGKTYHIAAAWRAPSKFDDYLSWNNTKGYYVKLYEQGSNIANCVFFDLHNAPWKTKKDINFKTHFPIRPGIRNVIELYSLPPVSERYITTIAAVVAGNTNKLAVALDSEDYETPSSVDEGTIALIVDLILLPAVALAVGIGFYRWAKTSSAANKKKEAPATTA